MRQERSQVLVLVWGLAILAAVVTLALAGVSTAVVLALIACMPHRLRDESKHEQHGKVMDGS